MRGLVEMAIVRSPHAHARELSKYEAAIHNIVNYHLTRITEAAA